MALADERREISRLMQLVSDRAFQGIGRVPVPEAPVGVGVLTGEEALSRGHAQRNLTVHVGDHGGLRGEPIEMRRVRESITGEPGHVGPVLVGKDPEHVRGAILARRSAGWPHGRQRQGSGASQQLASVGVLGAMRVQDPFLS